MSHPHIDHVGGVESVLSKGEVGEVWDTHANYSSASYQRILRRVSSDSISYRRISGGLWVSDFSPAQMYTFHPDSVYALSQKNINNVSIVMKLVYGDVSFLFVGDLEEEGDQELIPFGDMVHSHVLKVGHHGSGTSTTTSLLESVKPRFAVVSVGEGNRFGHPSSEVIRRIEEAGTKVWRTDVEGAIWFKTDGRRLWRYDWR